MSDKNKKPVSGHKTTTSPVNRWLLGTTSRIIPNTLNTLAIAGLILGANPAYALDAYATPQGGKVVGGSASIISTKGSVTINQKSNRAVLDWKSFNIGTKSKTEFKQPNAKSIAINRVVAGKDPTQILGTLKSNGQIIILDPNGVMFGATAKVDVGGIVASTGKVNTSQFMAGGKKLNLTGMTSGKVENKGRITVKSGGLAALVAPHVVNSGVIQANAGRVELVSGPAVTLDFYGDQMVSVAVSGTLADALVENSGKIQADGGRVAMTARAAQGVVDDVVNMSGVIRAQSVSQKDGRIILGGGNGGVSITGDINASGPSSTGGYVEVTGDRISLDGASINASGRNGGGEVYLGGDLNGATTRIKQRASVTEFSADSLVNADATHNGNGGLVVVWGDKRSEFYGNVTARGGRNSGNGGMVEVSTGDGVIFEGIVDTTAARGTVGELLIDPASVTIGNAPDAIDGTHLNAQNLANTMVFTDVIVMADNNIDIVDDIDLSSSIFGPSVFDLTLQTQVINLVNNIIMGSGDVHLLSPTLNLGATVTSGGNLLGGSRLTGTATQVNVLNDSASIQQAIDASSTSSAVMIDIAAGLYAGNLIVNKSLTLHGNVGAEISGTVPAGGIITVSAANVTIEGLSLDGTGSMNGVVASAAADSLDVNGNAFSGFGLDAVNVVGADGVIIRNNAIEGDGVGVSGAGRYGIFVQDGASAQVLNNVIRGMNGGTGAGDTAIYVQNNDGAVIDGNLIEGLSGGTGAVVNGIFATLSDNAQIINNTVHADADPASIGTGGTAFNFQNNLNLTDVNNQVIDDFVGPPPPPPPPPPDDDGDDDHGGNGHGDGDDHHGGHGHGGHGGHDHDGDDHHDHGKHKGHDKDRDDHDDHGKHKGHDKHGDNDRHHGGYDRD